jgi:hypothetical protein
VATGIDETADARGILGFYSGALSEPKTIETAPDEFCFVRRREPKIGNSKKRASA